MRTTSGWLVAGVALVGVMIGYMSGGSQTPVVSAAIPVIFGLVATAFAVLRTKGRHSAQHHREPAVLLHPTFALRRQEKNRLEVLSSAHLHKNIGIFLVTFSIGFLVGAHCGAYVRLHDILRPQTLRTDFAWRSQEPPPSVETALLWLAIQQRMEIAGYSENQVREIYQMHLKEWRTKTKISDGTIDISTTVSKVETSTAPSNSGQTAIATWLSPYHKRADVKGVISTDCSRPSGDGLFNFMLPKVEGAGLFSSTIKPQLQWQSQ